MLWPRLRNLVGVIVRRENGTDTLFFILIDNTSCQEAPYEGQTACASPCRSCRDGIIHTSFHYEPQFSQRESSCGDVNQSFVGSLSSYKEFGHMFPCVGVTTLDNMCCI